MDNIFTAVKATVAPREALERYGLLVTPTGFAVCPFHQDSRPSMKLYDDHYHCFSCGAHGDVTSLISKIYGLQPSTAARKIATDFGVIKSTPEIQKRVEDFQKVKEAQKYVDKVCSALESCMAKLNGWADTLTPGEFTLEVPPCDPRFIFALKHKDEIEIYLDEIRGEADSDILGARAIAEELVGGETAKMFALFYTLGAGNCLDDNADLFAKYI